MSPQRKLFDVWVSKHYPYYEITVGLAVLVTYVLILVSAIAFLIDISNWKWVGRAILLWAVVNVLSQWWTSIIIADFKSGNKKL